MSQTCSAITCCIYCYSINFCSNCSAKSKAGSIFFLKTHCMVWKIILFILFVLEIPWGGGGKRRKKAPALINIIACQASYGSWHANFKYASSVIISRPMSHYSVEKSRLVVVFFCFSFSSIVRIHFFPDLIFLVIIPFHFLISDSFTAN